MHLPSVPTSFVGRSEQLRQLSALFDQGTALVTLFGAGGSGKTRLALRYAESGWTHDVVLCDLTAAASLADVCGVIARTLSIDLASDRSEAATLAHLAKVIAARQRLLVILDNSEHVIDAVAAALQTFLAAAPAAAFLVTSRELLRLRGELAFEVGPLGLPSGDQVAACEAVQLFVDRARLVGREYEVDRDLPAVAELVARLDGLPLAIELAAARTGVLRATDVLAHLGRSVDVLAASARGVPDRHQTMRAAIEWSWALLTPAEQEALRQATIFRASFSLASAEAVIDLSGIAGAPPVIDVLESLRQKSLVRSFELPRVGIRFGLYGTIRAFAGERLDVDARAAALGRLLAWSLDAADRALDLKPRDLTERDIWLEPDVDNIVAAHDHALAMTPPRVSDALRLALGLERVLRARGEAPAMLALIRASEQAHRDAATGQPIDPALHARALIARAEAASVLESTRTGRRDLEQALSLAIACRDPVTEGRARGGLAFHDALERGDEPARDRFCEALDLQRRIGDEAGEARTLIRFGYTELIRRRIDTALEQFESGIVRAKQVGDHALEAMGLRYLGYVRFMRGEHAEAICRYEQAIALGERTGKAFRPALFAQDLALVYQELGEWEQAETLYQSAIHDQERHASEGRLGRTLVYYATLLHERDDLEQASRYYDQGVDLLARAPRSFELILLLARMFRAALLATTGNPTEAASEIDDVEQRASGFGLASMVDCVRAVRGHVELALARDRVVQGDRTGAAELRRSARDRLTAAAAAIQFDDMRLARRLLERAIAAIGSELLLVEETGRWFSPPDKDRVDLERHRRLRRVLAALARARLAVPGGVESVDSLFRAAWPGEQASTAVMANRIRVSIAALRDLGLRGLLLRRGAGYLLTPTVDLALVRSD